MWGFIFQHHGAYGDDQSGEMSDRKRFRLSDISDSLQFRVGKTAKSRSKKQKQYEFRSPLARTKQEDDDDLSWFT